MIPFQGTLINAGAVILGSLIGLIIHSRLPKKIVTIAFQAIGLFTLFLGIAMATKTANYLILIFSIIIGSVIGELIDIDHWMNSWSERLKARLHSKSRRFSEGLITAFLLFCMGSMTILGSLEEGMGNSSSLLIAKSLLDGFSSLALSSSLGLGVIFSVIPLIIYQGGLTLFAKSLQQFFTQAMINELSAVGGLMLIGMGINILEIKKLRVINMLPGLLIAIILSLIFL